MSALPRGQTVHAPHARQTQGEPEMPGVQELTPQALDDQLHRVADQMGRKFGDRAEGGEVESAVYEEAARFRTARVKQYIPVLVQHAVQERFRHRSPRVAGAA
jgi:hypothetical protein